MTDFNSTAMLDLNAYLNNTGSSGNARQDEDHQLLVASLMNDVRNIRDTQQSYGIPAVGDLFRARTEDVQETITSIYYMLRQRQADLEYRQEARAKWNKIESERQDAMD
jgi:hypothetical protein